MPSPSHILYFIDSPHKEDSASSSAPPPPSAAAAESSVIDLTETDDEVSDAETEIHDVSMSSSASTPRTSQTNTESDSEKLVWHPAAPAGPSSIGCEDSPAPISIDTSSCSYTSSPILNLASSGVANGDDAPISLDTTISLDTSNSSIDQSPRYAAHSPTLSSIKSSPPHFSKNESLFNLTTSPIYCSPGSSSSRATPNSTSADYCGPPSPFHQPSPGPSSPVHTDTRSNSHISIMSPLRNSNRSSPYALPSYNKGRTTRSQSKSSSEDMLPPNGHIVPPHLSPVSQSQHHHSRNTPPLLHAAPHPSETPPPAHRNTNTPLHNRPSSRHTPGSVHSVYSNHSSHTSPPPSMVTQNLHSHSPSPGLYSHHASSLLGTDSLLPQYGAGIPQYDEYLQFMSGILPYYSAAHGQVPSLFPNLNTAAALNQFSGELTYDEALRATENLSSHTHT